MPIWYGIADRRPGHKGWRDFMPTGIDPKRRLKLEPVIDAAYLAGYVYGKDDSITISWSDDMETHDYLGLSLCDHSGKTYQEVTKTEAKVSTSYKMLTGARLKDGAYKVIVHPWLREYYEHNQRVTNEIDLHVVKEPYSHNLTVPLKRVGKRLCCLHAANQSGALFGEIAKMTLGLWSEIVPETTAAAIESAGQPFARSGSTLLDLLGMIHRYRSHPSFLTQLTQQLDECTTDFCEANHVRDSFTDEASEGQEIIDYACQILAGQHYSDQDFILAGCNGAELCARGEELALRWMYDRVPRGFREWDSDRSLAEMLAALAHLVDLAKHEDVQELAAILMDKIFLTCALNSCRGVFGSTQGRAESPLLRDARLMANGYGSHYPLHVES